MTGSDSIELEPVRGIFEPGVDRRRRLDEPLGVRLIAVADVRQPARVGDEPALDAFYAGLLELEREGLAGGPVYRSDSFRLRFDLHEGLIQRVDLRPLGIEVRSLGLMQEKLITAEIEHTRQRGLQPGRESLVLMDPAGNWLELTEFRLV